MLNQLEVSEMAGNRVVDVLGLSLRYVGRI